MHIYSAPIVRQNVDTAAFSRRIRRQHPIRYVHRHQRHSGGKRRAAQATPLLTTTTHLGLSEEQITDIFSDAGKVERFRLVYDSETGRPKGFGFAEYPDTGMFFSFPMELSTKCNDFVQPLTTSRRFCVVSRTKPQRLRNHGPQASRRLL